MNANASVLLAVSVVITSVARAANVVPNPDFDSGLDGWSQIGSGTVTMDSANGLPHPPSVRLRADSAQEIAIVSSCIQIDDSVHAYFQMQAAAQPGYVSGRIEPFSDATCENSLGAIDTEPFTPYQVGAPTDCLISRCLVGQGAPK